ncbi:MAG: AI-2E family transporter [Chloroflexota bacterium]
MQDIPGGERPDYPSEQHAVEPAGRGRDRRPGLTPVTLLLTLLVAWLLYQAQVLVVLVILSVILATIIEKPVLRLERRHSPRPLGILLVYVAIIGGIVLLFTLVGPTVKDQAIVFREQAPAQVESLQASWRSSPNALLNGVGADLLGRGIDIVRNPQLSGVKLPSDAALGLLTGIGGGVISFFTVLVITFYYIMEKQWIRRLILLELPPENRQRVARVWDAVEDKVGGWLRGQLVLCLVIGVLATVGYAAMGLRFWPLLGLWAGLTEIIPILGPWLGGVPAVIIALTQGWEKAILVILFVVGLQLLENTVLVPRVMRGAVGLSPMTVFLAILAGTQVLGVSGAILAIPVAATIQVLVAEWLESRKGAGVKPAAPNWRWMRGSGERAPGTPANAAGDPPSNWSADAIQRAKGDNLPH